MMSLGLIIFGVIGLARLPVRELPDIDPPIVNVTTVYQGASAAVIETQISEPIEEEWFGWRPMTPDSKPIIDRSPALNNVLLAAGHNMLGLSMAPATGKLIAEMLGGRVPHLDCSAYAVGRF